MEEERKQKNMYVCVFQKQLAEAKEKAKEEKAAAEARAAEAKAELERHITQSEAKSVEAEKANDEVRRVLCVAQAAPDPPSRAPGNISSARAA